MSSNKSVSSIVIPIQKKNNFIEFFPDELPQDFNDLSDILRAEFAPLTAWKSSAVEYYRQGLSVEFEFILKEIVDAIAISSVEEFYKSKDNYKEAMIQIYDTFAAYYLVKYWHCIDNKSDSNNIVEEDETYYAQQIVSFLKYADGVDPMYEFSWLIKGFYELRQAASIPSYSNKTTQSEYNRAQKHFQSIVNNYTQSKKKLSPDSMVSRLAYGAYIGLGVVAYNEGKYKTALDYFNQGIISNPIAALAFNETECTISAATKAPIVAAGGSVSLRVAYGTCCYHLGQYDRAKIALERAIELDPCNVNALILMGYLEQVKSVVTTTSASSAVSTGSVYQNNFWQAGYEYMTLANTIVTNNSYVGNATSAAVVTCSNQIANHLFLTWYNLDNAAQLIDDSTVLVHGPGGGEWDGEVIRELIGDIASGDGVKFTVNGAVFESYIADVHVVMENSQSIGNDKAILRIHLQSPVPLVIVNQCHDDKIAVSIKKYGQVGQLLTKSMSICSVILGPSTKTGSISCSAVNRSMHALKSESCYLLGRLHHLLHQNESSHSKLSDAIAHYELCLLHGGLHLESKSTDTICNSSIVSLAMYQLGQIYLSQQEFLKSLDMFEFLIKFRQEKDNKEMNSRSEAQSLLLHNQNRDVSAYIMLIKSMQRQEICESFDELADAVASGSFPYAFELWLSQAQLRVYKGMDSTGSPNSEAYLSALKCFDRACQCLNGIVSESRISGRPLTAVQQQQVAELPLIYANMASVYHALGNTFKSYEFNCLSLKSLASEQENVDEGDSDLLAGSRTVFHHAENSMFYKWIECDGSYRFRYNSEASVGDSLRFDVVNSKANGEDLDACVFDTDLFVNNDVMINGVLCTITETVTEDVRDKQPETAADEDAMEVSSGGGGMYDDIEDQVSEVVIQKQSKKRVVSIAVTSLILKLRMENDRDEAEAIARLRLEAAEKAKAEAAREVEDDLFGDEDETDAPANVDADSFTVPEYVIRYKASLNNATNINVVFNMARILEDKGATTAAIELYTFLLKMHPMYIECYVRLGVIQKELGNIENGIHWMKKALECIEKHSQDTPAEDAESVNATLNIGIHKNNCHMLLGYMYAINGNMDRGQKEFDVVCRKTSSPDAASMISLGNLFFTNLHSFPSSGSHATLSTLHKYDTLLKDSYKFYHHAITATKTQASSQSVGVHTNAFAAQGLGMVLAEKGYLDVARDIFGRMRESDMGHCKVQTNMIMDSENISLVGTPGVTMTAPSTSTVPSNGKLTMTVDVCCNLAHINLVQGRVLDAIYMYQTALKACMVVGSTQVVIKDGDAKGKTHIYQLINTSSVKSILSVISISECLALAFLKNNEYDNALQTLCKALWYADPGVATSTMASNSTLAAANASLIQTYYNIAYICEEHGLYVLFKKNGGNNVMNATVADVKTAIREFNAACRYYGALAALPRDSTNPATSYSSAYVKYIFNGAHSKRLALDQKQSLAHHAYCFENVENATKLLNRARLEEEKLLDKNLLLEAETSSRLQEKQQKMNAEQLAQEEKLRLIQEKAVQKRMHLEKLQENWSAAPAATAASGSNKGSKSKKSKELDRSIYDSDEDDNAIQQKAREIKKKEQAQVAEAEIESESESDIGDVGDSSSDEGEYSAGSDHDSDNDGGAIQGLDAKKQRKEERKRLRKAERKEKRRQEKKLLKAQKRDKNVDSIDATLNTQENPNKKRRLLPKNAGQSDDEMETDVVSNTTSEHASIDPATTKKRSILDDSDDDEDALF